MTTTRRSLVSFVRFQWMHRFTPGGRAVVLAVLAVAGPATAFPIQVPMYIFSVLLLATLVVDALVGRPFRPRVTIERRLPERCAVGASVDVRARVTNRGWLPAFDLAIRELSSPHPLLLDRQPALCGYLARGETRELRYVVHPLRRGAYDLPGPEAISSFPFGLYFDRRKTFAPHRMLVYPRFHPLAVLRLPSARRHQPGGLELVSHVGDSEEFCGLREYRPGDSLRDLHHKAWARRGLPVVCEYQQEYLTRIALVVDTFQPRPSPAATRAVEAAISLGAAVADALAREEYVVDVFAAGPDLYHFQAGRSLAFLDDVLDVLACVEECRGDPFPKLSDALLDEIGRISTAVCVFLEWDEARLAFCREIQERGAVPMVLVVKDGSTTLDPSAFPGAAGAPRCFTPQDVEAGIDVL